MQLLYFDNHNGYPSVNKKNKYHNVITRKK